MARDLRTDTVVGLKILDPKKTAAFEGRFRGLNKPSEGEIAVQFKHPNIVETTEFGLTTDGAPYLVPLSFDWDGEALLAAGHRVVTIHTCQGLFLRVDTSDKSACFSRMSG